MIYVDWVTWKEHDLNKLLESNPSGPDRSVVVEESDLLMDVPKMRYAEFSPLYRYLFVLNNG
jgi:hypothetical protein